MTRKTGLAKRLQVNPVRPGRHERMLVYDFCIRLIAIKKEISVDLIGANLLLLNLFLVTIFRPLHFFKHNFSKTCAWRNILIILFLFTIFFSPFKCLAQDSAANSVTQQQIWPEVDLFYRLNDKFRIFASASATHLYEASTYTDGGISANLGYTTFPKKRKEKTAADSTRGHLLWWRGGF